MDKASKTSFILLSGGQDSTTSLFWAKSQFERVEAVNFLYGQRHSIEIESARKVTQIAGVSLTEIDLGKLFSQIGDSALVGEGDISLSHRVGDLPASFVPGRNMIFLTVAAMLAFKKGISNIVGGMCQTDYCVSGNTLIETPRNLEEYPYGIPIKKLVGKRFLVWSWDVRNQRTVLRPAFNVRKTLEQDKVYEVKYCWGIGRNQQCRSIRVNENHKFLLADGTYRSLKNLNIGESLQPFHTAWDKNYRLITDRPGHVYYEHKMIASQINDLDITNEYGWVGHHKDHNPLNNNPENIIPQDFSSHIAYHTSETWKRGIMFQNNLFLNDNPMSYEKYRRKVADKKKKWWNDLSVEERKKLSENAKQATLRQMKQEKYVNPSLLPGVKFKQRYAAHKRYGNERGMRQTKEEAERGGFSLNHKIVAIEYVGREDVYDMEVFDTHNFATNGIFVHNSGYPDCRREFIDTLVTSLNSAMAPPIPFNIHTPLMYLTKAQSVEVAMKMRGCMEALAWSHTCYEGQVPPCGECPACKIRAKGFEEAGVEDPLLVRLWRRDEKVKE